MERTDKTVAVLVSTFLLPLCVSHMLLVINPCLQAATGSIICLSAWAPMLVAGNALKASAKAIGSQQLSEFALDLVHNARSQLGYKMYQLVRGSILKVEHHTFDSDSEEETGRE